MNRRISTHVILLAGVLLLQGCFSLLSSGPGCTNTCEFAFDGDCDDGGPDSDYDLCDYGTDCSDCGSRGDGGGSGYSWAACPSSAGDSCVGMNIGEAADPAQAFSDFQASCADSNDGDSGSYVSGRCSTSGTVARCDNAWGTMETTGELVPIEVVWYASACGLDLRGTCENSLSGTFTDFGGC